MSKLSSLAKTKTKSSSKRLGRGHSSGKGKTSGRGHKGYHSRTGSTLRWRFEGGQMPLVSRIPKLKGFKPINKLKYMVINVCDLEKYSKDGLISKKHLRKLGILKRGYKLKILGSGDIKKSIKIEADAWVKSAEDKIKKAGGDILKTLDTKKKK